MHQYQKFCVVGVLLSLAMGPEAVAQSAAKEVDVPRWYLGLQGLYQQLNGLRPLPNRDDYNDYERAVFAGPVLWGGWQCKPRMALELGVGSSWSG